MDDLNALKDFFNQRNFSPTPVPRKKLIYGVYSPSSTLSSSSSSNTNTRPCLLHEQSTLADEQSSPTQNLNITTDGRTNTSLVRPGNFSSSTMPLPRKPRKVTKCPDEPTNEKSTNMSPSINQTNFYCFVNTSYAVSTSTKQQEVPFFHEIIREQPSTLKIERTRQLKRPTAPPPPPPSEPSSASLFFKNISSASSSSSSSSSSTYLNTSNSFAIIDSPQPPRLSSTPKVGLGFVNYNNSIYSNRAEDDTDMKLTIRLIKNPKFFHSTVLLLCTVLFLGCILLITVFQTKANSFYMRFLNNQTNQTDNRTDGEYYSTGTQLVKQTILLCNGSYFSYQMNNLIVLPFSVFLVVVFSFLNPSKASASKCSVRPRLPAHVNPFQRRNRFLTAALFCILANEIFRMIESSLFVISKAPSSEPFNTTNEFINFLVRTTNQTGMGTAAAVELSKIGFGIEPDILRTTVRPTVPTTTKSFYLILPSVMSYSKPKLKPRLELSDFTPLSTSNPPQVITIHLDSVKAVRNKSLAVLNDLNRTLVDSGDKTLFEMTMSVYRNEYVQSMLRLWLPSAGDLNWSIVLTKLRKILFMLVEVFLIGMRYYPLLGVVDNNSFVCLLLASVYMWADVAYNVTITGLCEGLRLNVSFDLLKNIRQLFGVGSLLVSSSSSSSSTQPDVKFLFSTNRIVYTIVKSLPHFFCLSYVTVRFSLACYLKVHEFFRTLRRRKSNDDARITSKMNVSNRVYDLVYTKKYPTKVNSICYKQLSYEDGYVRGLLAKKRVEFRYSNRIVCTYTVCFTVLYYLTCFFIFYGCVFVDLIYFPPVYKQSIALSAVVTSVVCLVQLVLSLRKFRGQLVSLYRGKGDMRPMGGLFSNRKIATSSFNYAGYAVTYTCWGYVILFGLMTFVLVQIATLVAFGATTSSIGLFVLMLLVPFGVSVVLMRLLNRLMSSLAARFCFLQSNARVLALKNFKVFSLFLYFKFFYDCFTGVAFCFLRMLKLAMMGVIFFTRLDYSFMGRSCESMDHAFMSYIGYLYWESHHTNPVAISFCNILQREIKLQAMARRQLFYCSNDRKKRHIRNKWFLAYTLIKNRRLINFRKI